MSFRLTYDEMIATEAKIGKINLRAARRGFTGRLTITSEPVTVKTTNAIGLDIEEIKYDVTIGGTAPSYGGYRFLATLDWDTEAGLVTRTAPGVDTIDRTGLRDGYCDHCKTNRDRKHTFLVQNETTGERHQVGSTCIKDFLGWDTAPVFMSTSSVEEEISKLLGGGGFGERRWTVESALAVAWAVVQAYGYHRAGSDSPTKYTVLEVLDPFTPRMRELARDLAPYVDAAAGNAKLVRDWVLSDEFSGNSEYAMNLKNIARAETVSARNIGVLASAVSVWTRAQEREVRRQQETAELINEWVGKPKDKLTLNVTVRAVRPIDTIYGTSTLYTLASDTHHVFTWFASNPILGDDVGATFTITGTVKGHDEYRGTKQTKLTRCKIAK